MKKKKLRYSVLTFFALLITFSFVPNAKASIKVVPIADVENATCLSSVTMQKTKYVNYKTASGAYGDTPVYFMYIGGQLGLCLDHSKTLSNTSKLVPGGCTQSSIPKQAKQALAYCEDTNCINNEKTHIIAQLYAWGASEVDMVGALGSIEVNGGMPVFEAGYEGKNRSINHLTDRGQQYYDEYVYPTLQKIHGADISGTYYCNYGGSSLQPVVTRLKPKCTAKSVGPSDERIFCPPGTKNAGKVDITELAAQIGYEKAVLQLCEENKACKGVAFRPAGNLTMCEDNNSSTSSIFYEETDGIESENFTGSKDNGNMMGIVIGNGSYCALYCKEHDTKAILPGGLANPITVGSPLTWPTSAGTSSSKWGNMFPVEFKGEKTCKLQVAPNLTYGNSCELYPDQEYEKAIASYKSSYDKEKHYSGLVDAAKEANTSKHLKHLSAWLGVKFDVTSNKIPEAVFKSSNDRKILDYSDEMIRLYVDNQKIYLNQFDVYEPENSGFFAGKYNLYDIGIKNSNAADKAYNEAWTTYCDSNHRKYVDADSDEICTGKVLIVKGRDEPICEGEWKTVYSCKHGRNLTKDHKCECNEGAANEEDGDVKTFHEIKDVWNEYKNEIVSRRNQYVKYITNYQNVLGIYYEIRLCEGFGIASDKYDEKAGNNFTCGDDSCAFYHFVTSAEMSYEDEEYGTSYSLVKEVPTTYSCTGCDSNFDMSPAKSLLEGKPADGYKKIINPTDHGVEYLKKQIENIELREINIYANTTTYSLPYGLYNYVNKRTNRYYMSKPEDNYETIGLDKNDFFLYSNLPTSMNKKFGYKYYLKISSITLGDDGQFNADSVGIGEYICHYTVATDYDECLCPPGTKNEGVDLTGALLEEYRLTCADAKVKYCDADNVPECPDCPEDKYCSNNKSIKITACLNAGYTKDECESRLCNEKYICESGKKKGMDITSCVQTRIMQGDSVDSAKKYCHNTVCNGVTIIYRPIDLSNPFPSIDADQSVKQSGLNVNDFNLNVKGRYPGYNWNGKQVVKNNIFKNREVSTTDVYNQTPLYHFELDTATILNIRDYNKDKKYDDFTLDCVTAYDNPRLGTSCLSGFVHNEIYGGDVHGNKSLCGGAGTTSALGDCLYGKEGG